MNKVEGFYAIHYIKMSEYLEMHVGGVCKAANEVL